MSAPSFDAFFQAEARMFLLASIKMALAEDGPDLTSDGLFDEQDQAQAHIVAKAPAVVAGLPIVPLVLEMAGGGCTVHLNVDDGEEVSDGALLAAIQGPARVLLKAERAALNFLTHLSGVATLTRAYVRALENSETILLDTRKTLPGLRYPEKYAVRCGGGANHRKNLTEMLMLKDNHIDRAGSIQGAVDRLRAAYSPCPPLEVECRTLDDVRDAVAAEVDRIMLDNMTVEQMREAVALIPEETESEISGGVDLATLAELGTIGADYVSVGRLTHSAPAADMSMRLSTL